MVQMTQIFRGEGKFNSCLNILNQEQIKMNEWIAPRLTGGLGNRLFEFAAALGLAEKYKKPCIFLKTQFTRNDHGPMDSICKLYPSIPVVETSAEVQTMYYERRNGCFVYDPFPEVPAGHCIVVDGWRQSEKYFPKNKEDLVPSWTAFLTDQDQLKLQQIYGLNTQEKRQKTWFLHVRLGDYKVLPHHQIPILPYYQTCLNQVPKDHKVYLFSDEPHLCGQWVESQCKSRGLQFEVCNESDEIRALYVMSQCWGGAIVANSTFSWWGAYFAWLAQGQKDSYKAFYPSIWGQGLPPAIDVVPRFGKTVEIQL